MSQEVSKATPSQWIPSAGQLSPSFQSYFTRIADDVIGFTLCHLHQTQQRLGASCPPGPSLGPWDLLLSGIVVRRVEK